MTIKDEFAEKLRLLRADRGLSQIDLATQAGIAPAQLSRYELGKSYPRAEVLAKLADALGVPRRELATKGPERGLSVHLPIDLIGKLTASAAKRLDVREVTRDELSDEVRIRLEASFSSNPEATSPMPNALDEIVEKAVVKLRSRLDKILLDATIEHGFKDELVQRMKGAMTEQQRRELGLDLERPSVEPSDQADTAPLLVKTSRDALLKPLSMVAGIVENRNKDKDGNPILGDSGNPSRTPTIPGQNSPKKGIGAAPKPEKPKREKPVVTKKRVFVRDEDASKIKLDHTSKEKDK